MPYYSNPSGRDFFCWGGRGKGYRNWYYDTGFPGWMRVQRGYPSFGMPPYPFSFEMKEKEELEFLKKQAEILQKHLKEVKEQIEILERSIEKEK
ncbi:MAG: DUF5320 domain-containing protein [Thermoanaerobaculia bacterium]